MALTDEATLAGDLAEHIAGHLAAAVREVAVDHGELVITTTADDVLRVLSYLRDDSRCQFKALMDLTVVDYPTRAARFDVVYILLSIATVQRVRVKVATDEATPVPSAVPVFSSAAWYEREAWDMYGVYFSEHPDLRRLLTDYGFEGHPAQGFPADRPRSGALRRGRKTGGSGTRATGPGFSKFRLFVALGRGHLVTPR